MYTNVWTHLVQSADCWNFTSWLQKGHLAISMLRIAKQLAVSGRSLAPIAWRRRIIKSSIDILSFNSNLLATYELNITILRFHHANIEVVPANLSLLNGCFVIFESPCNSAARNPQLLQHKKSRQHRFWTGWSLGGDRALGWGGSGYGSDRTVWQSSPILSHNYPQTKPDAATFLQSNKVVIHSKSDSVKTSSCVSCPRGSQSNTKDHMQAGKPSLGPCKCERH